MGMGVDEAGGEDLAGGVDLARGGVAAEVADGGDARALDGDVGAVAGGAGAVDDGGVAEDEVVLGHGSEGIMAGAAG